MPIPATTANERSFIVTPSHRIPLIFRWASAVSKSFGHFSANSTDGTIFANA